MILFSAIEYADCTGAYYWHRGFAGANDSLYPRSFEDFERLVMDGCVWAARETNGDYLALAYANYDETEKVCEIGGLMVATKMRGKGLGSTMMRLTLSHAILEENVLSDPDTRVVAHVLKSNDLPRGIIVGQLRFHHAKPVEYPGEKLPGLRTDSDGIVRGDEYHLTRPETLQALADWARDWNGALPGNVIADVDLRTGVTMELWSKALQDLADEGDPHLALTPPDEVAVERADAEGDGRDLGRND